MIRSNTKLIFGIILGVIISNTTIYAANFASGDVEHTKSNGTKTTVQAALNELYTIHNSGTAVTSDILSGRRNRVAASDAPAVPPATADHVHARRQRNSRSIMRSRLSSRNKTKNRQSEMLCRLYLYLI